MPWRTSANQSSASIHITIIIILILVEAKIPCNSCVLRRMPFASLSTPVNKHLPTLSFPFEIKPKTFDGCHQRNLPGSSSETHLRHPSLVSSHAHTGGDTSPTHPGNAHVDVCSVACRTTYVSRPRFFSFSFQFFFLLLHFFLRV